MPGVSGGEEGVAALRSMSNSRLTKFDRILGDAVVRFLVGQGWSL